MPSTAAPPVWWREGRWRTAARAIGAGLITLAALYAHVVTVALATQDCMVGFDTDSEPPPADASPQGWLCANEGWSSGAVVWYGGFAVSLGTTLVLILLAWRRWSWRGGIPALLLIVALPLATAYVLNLPSDDCTANGREASPDWACSRG